ncbi:MAG: YsnF/AvaK domain-containing protein, partial [Acidobacteriaceae bacterium]|nr:YsnF/AvaK domain-containing protein [Acidobacteriaceae bacterium]
MPFPLEHLGTIEGSGSSTVNSNGETVIPLLEEELSVSKQVTETARVRVSRVTCSHEHVVDELLRQEKVEVERIPVNRTVETMPSIRQEGDVTI